MENIRDTKAITAETDIGNGRHVLFISQSLPVPADIRVWQQATELTKNGYTVSVICPKGDGMSESHEVLENINIFRYPATTKGKGAIGQMSEYIMSLMWQFMFAYRAFFTVGFDVIQGCSPPDNLFIIGGFFKLFFSKKFVFDQRRLSPEHYKTQSGKRDFLYKIMLWWERMSYKTAAVILVSDTNCLRAALERGGRLPEKIFTVRTAPDLSRMYVVSPEPAFKAGRKYLVSCIGFVTDQSAFKDFIEAIRIVLETKKRTDIHFLFCGGGPVLQDLRKLAAVQGVVDNITFIGHVSDETLLQIISSSDICFNPDGDESIASLNAMALGKPVIQFTDAPSVPGNRTLNAPTGNSKDLAQKIIVLLGDPERCRQMGESGRVYIENEFCWSLEAPKLLAAYEHLFAGAKKS